MRKHIILLYLIILSASCFAQTVTKTVGIVYTAGAPAHAPAAKVGSQVAIDTATWEWYEYNGSAWIASGDRIQSISGCSAPNYTPTKYQSRLVINACTAGQGGPELYYYTGGSWLQINEGQTYTAGGGISIAGGQISASDISPTNEIQTLSIAGSNLSISSGNTVSLPTGLTSLNGLTGGAQTFSTGTSGTDFDISSSGTAHTFNIPSASASNRGLLMSADWSVFNAKIGGSGAAGQIPYMSASTTITTESGSGANNLAWDASNNRLGIGTASPSATLHVQGSSVLFQNSGALSLTLNDASNGNIPAVYFQQGGTTRATIEAGVGLSAGLFFSSGVTRLMSFGYGTASSSKFGRTYAGDTSGPVDGIAVEGLSGFGSLAPTSRAHINGANGYTQFRLEKTYTPTGTSDALGATGDIAWDDNYFYIKTAAGWKRAALSTF